MEIEAQRGATTSIHGLCRVTGKPTYFTAAVVVVM
jgi:hypothetical protein